MTAPGIKSVDRTASRRRILKSGVISYSGRQITINCLVRDFSESGARLVIEGAVEAPDTFELLMDIDGFEADCRVVWRRGKEIGVTFGGALRRTERRRAQVVQQWSNAPKPSLRRQPKGTT